MKLGLKTTCCWDCPHYAGHHGSRVLSLACSIFLRTRERLCMNPARSLLNMRGTLVGYSLEPRPERRVRGTAGSVMTVRLSVNGCSHTKSQFDQFKQDSQVQKRGLRRVQRFEAIQAEPPFLLLDQEVDKTRLCSQGFCRNNCSGVSMGTAELKNGLRCFFLGQIYLFIHLDAST